MSIQHATGSRWPVPEPADWPDDVRARIDDVATRMGFVPHVFAVLARRPAEFHAFFDHYEALMGRDGGLTKAEKEMVVVVTSSANECLYCVVSHGALLRIFSRDPLLGDQVATDHRKAPLSARQRAMLDFALKVATRSVEVGDEDLAALRSHGFDDEDIWDIGAITALFQSDGQPHGDAPQPRVL